MKNFIVSILEPILSLLVVAYTLRLQLAPIRP
jgi:hypothetical protein